MTEKWATKEATEKYFQLHSIHPDKKRKLGDLTISAFGAGTYIGECDERNDDLFEKALVKVITSGINFIDTAINYRCQRSERNIAKALKELKSIGIPRDQIVISSKGGFLPGDTNPEEYEAHIRSEYIDSGIISHHDIVQDCHCMTPKFIEVEINKSLKNMDIDCIDLYYIHNPETQLMEVPEEEFYKRVALCFELLERKVEEGKICRYGFATWNGFRQKSETKGYLNLAKILEVAKKVAGKGHHFKAIQLPYNLVMLEAVKVHNQIIEEGKGSILTAAKELHVEVMISAPLMQSQVLYLPQRIFDGMPQESSSIHKALQFVISTPNVTSALLGMKNPDHLHENLKILQLPDWKPEDMKDLWKLLGI